MPWFWLHPRGATGLLRSWTGDRGWTNPDTPPPKKKLSFPAQKPTNDPNKKSEQNEKTHNWTCTETFRANGNIEIIRNHQHLEKPFQNMNFLDLEVTGSCGFCIYHLTRKIQFHIPKSKACLWINSENIMFCGSLYCTNRQKHDNDSWLLISCNIKRF